MELEQGKKIMVIIQEESVKSEDRDDFLNMSEGYLSHAYGENEPEYDLGMIKEPNSKYGL